MTDLIILGAVTAAGYALSVYTWPALRTFFVGAEQELAQLKARASELEAKLRAVIGGQS
jgi:hypothetical protein